MKLNYHFDGTHNFILFTGKTKLNTPAGAWCNYSPPRDGESAVVQMMYATRETRIYAPLLLAVLALHSIETYGELPVGSHDLSCHSFPIQNRLASILGQLPATAPINYEDWFSSLRWMAHWSKLSETQYQELPLTKLDEGKKFLLEIVRAEITGQTQPAFIESKSIFAARRRANGCALDFAEAKASLIGA